MGSTLPGLRATRTPTYVYDLGGVSSEAGTLRLAFEGTPHRVAYAVKANSAGPIVRTLLAEGCGADVVSGSELALALACGMSAAAIVFSGVAKMDRRSRRCHRRRAVQASARSRSKSVEEILRVAARARALRDCGVLRIACVINPAVEPRDDGDALAYR